MRHRRGGCACAGAGLLALAACATVEVTPAALRAAHASELARQDTEQIWRDAIALANEFLESPFRRTLPRGRFELDDGRGMSFLSPLGTWPIAVRCNRWGDLCLTFGFAAQEREYGFVVGEREPERDRVLDNSLFAQASDRRSPASAVAELILHETTHVVWREGTVGFWNGVAYYLEAIFLFRYSDHSGERKANATGEEFDAFFAGRTWRANGDEARAIEAADAFEVHVKGESDSCRHGPFARDPPQAPLPPAPAPSATPVEGSS